jgi:hypothetical protein
MVVRRTAAVVARVPAPWLPSSGGCEYPIYFCSDMEVSYCSI